MKIVTSILVFLAELSNGYVPWRYAALASANAAQVEEQLVYADFDTLKNNGPVSSRGGYITNIRLSSL